MAQMEIFWTATAVKQKCKTSSKIKKYLRNTTLQAVSKHLRILTECEFVKQEHQGREIYYSLEIDKMKEIDKWLSQFRRIWETRFNQLDKVLLTIKNNKK